MTCSKSAQVCRVNSAEVMSGSSAMTENVTIVCTTAVTHIARPSPETGSRSEVPMTIDPSHRALGQLELVRSLANTEDRYGGHDTLADPDRARAWLAEQGAGTRGQRLSASQLDDLIQLRTTVQDLAAANTNGQPSSPETVVEFNRICAAQPRVVWLQQDDAADLRAGLRAHQAERLPVAGEVVAAVHEAIIAGTWSRVKACANPECRWLFYDTSRSRTGRWCSMAACGSLRKARAYRDRRRARAET